MNKTLSVPIKFYSISDSDNPDFLKVKIMAIKEGLNLNASDFLLESMQNCKDTFKGKPLMCAFPRNYMSNDYKLGDGHNSELKWDDEENLFYYSYLDPDSERCIGIIPSDGNITIENIDGENWICVEGLIFKKYNYELVKELIKKDSPSKVSVEIEVLSSYEKDEIEYIESFIGDGVTLLALDDSVHEGIPGANLKVFLQSDKFARFKQSFNFAYSQNKLKEIQQNESTNENTDKKELNIENKKEEHNMKQYIEEAKKAGFSFLGFENDNLIFAKDIKCEDDMGDEDYKKEKMSLYEVSVEFASKEFKSEDLKEKSLKMEDDMSCHEKEIQSLKDQYNELEKSFSNEKVKCEELAKKCEGNDVELTKLSQEKDELTKKCEESDTKCKDMEAKFTEIQNKYSEIIAKQFEEETNAILQFSDLGLDESEVSELCNMRKEGKFLCVEDFKKEVAYKQFLKKEKINKESSQGLTFGLDKSNKQTSQVKNDFDKLAEEYGC